MADIIRLHNHILKPRWEWRPKLNPNHPLSIGLVGLWLFNETGGLKAYDLSGKNNHGTLTNDPAWKPGKFGQSLSFDGTNDYVKAGYPVITGTFTVAVWAKVQDTSARCMVGTRSPIECSFDMKFTSGNLIHADIGTGNGSVWITTAADASFSYSINTWYHIVYVVTPTGYTIYANGNQVGSGLYAENTPVFSNADHEIAIGAYRTLGGENFYGFIDGVRIYKRALSAKEIRWLYQEPFAGIDVPIFKDYWPEVAIGGLSIPVAMRHYREMRS